ncbi:MAG: hypothetical protein IT159_03700 [Bryobacterales bacterium]|nr:hypothetical protein [Bryobacterales bacterium]
MSALELLNAYLKRLESRFRLAALARGAALVAVAALAATVALVLGVNWLAFSERSLTAGRVILFLSLAFAAAFGVILPLMRLNRRYTARRAEQRIPDFDQRLLTVAERQDDPAQRPFLELLAADTLPLTGQAEPRAVVSQPLLAGFLSTAAVALGALIWLILGASGFLGHGARLLWAGPPRGESPAFYDIVVTPGDKTVRRGASQPVTAQLIGFESPAVRLFARYKDSAKWEEAPMVQQPGSLQYEFLFAGIPETVEYYAAAGRLRSKSHTLTVVDVPGVKRMRVTYRYPAWTGLRPETEDPGGDLRAVEGTEAEVAIETDRPLENGQLILEDGGKVTLTRGEGNWVSGRVRIQQDGSYFVAALDRGEQVRLTDDYFIEARRDEKPIVRILRPGRDARVSPIEEVVVAVDAADDFGLQDLTLHYSVNAGPEKTVPLLKQKGGLEGDGSVLLALEDHKLSAGDMVSFYATARDAKTTAQTDIFFLEAQPFEREYTQSQQMGGGGGGEGGQRGEREGQISQRQKEIISATWNQLRDKSADKKAAAENAQFLSDMQAKLRDQAQSLSTRMGRRELTRENEEFRDFGNEMQEAAKDMTMAAERLKAGKWQEALAPEQQALAHLLRAESTYRKIQVAFGNRGQQGGGGGGGGGGAQRDLENLFDLELDTERNQYETGQQASAGASQRAREIDEALQRLEQLARRQQELANRARQPQQSLQQRWQQELLRREAEQLQQRMEQLAQGNQGQPGSGQGGRQSGSGDARLDQALRRLSEATEDMRRANSGQNGNPQQGQSDSRRAAERLREAQDLMRGVRGQQANEQLDELSRRAESLAEQQQKFQEELRRAMGSQSAEAQAGSRPSTGSQLEQSRKLAEQRDGMSEELSRIEREMQQSVRDLAGSQRAAASRLREALGDLQQNEIGTRMRYNSDLLRRGYGAYVLPREAPITQGLNALRDQLRGARGALDRPSAERGSQEQALARLEQLRNRLQGAARPGQQQGGQRGQAGQQGQQAGQGRQGQAGQQGQPGQQGQQGQGGGGGGGQAGGERGNQMAGGRGGFGGRDGGYRDGNGNWIDGQERGGVRYEGENRGFDRSAMNRGDWRAAPIPPLTGAVNEAELARIYQESMRDLAALRDSLTGTTAGTRDIQDLLEEMKRLDPSRYPGNPELVERIRTQILPALEQMELQLRRQLEDAEGGQVRNAGSESVPPGYSGAVADYFRRLGKSK